MEKSTSSMSSKPSSFSPACRPTGGDMSITLYASGRDGVQTAGDSARPDRRSDKCPGLEYWRERREGSESS